MATPSASAAPQTGDIYIDVSTTGYYWQLDPGRTIRWSIANGFSGEYWTNPAATVNVLADIFARIESFIDVRFQYSGYYTTPSVAASFGSDITISLDGSFRFFSSSSQWGRAFFPTTVLGSSYNGQPGDVFLNILSPANMLSYLPGTAGYFLVLHELGHALGLKHTHDGGSTGRPTLAALGIGDLDRDWFSVMSYEDDFSWNTLEWDPSTPMVLDVLGLQALYGPNNATNAADSRYFLQRDQQYHTIWDAGGTDTVDISSAVGGWQIELPDFQLSTLVPTLIGLALPMEDRFLDSPHSAYWLMGNLENVIGSVYADEIDGNRFANSIAGSGGDDILTGGGGNDVMSGGAGDDLIFGGDRLDTVTYPGRQAQYWTERAPGGALTVGGPDGQDTLSSVERLSFEDVLVQTNRTLRDFTGDGMDDLMLYHNAGYLVMWKMGDVGYTSVTVREGMSQGWRLLPGDFNGDDTTDLLLNHANGALVMWEMRNGDVVRSAEVTSGLSTSWNVSVADFSGDGKADILLNHANGAVVLWQMDGGRIVARTTVAEGMSPAWKLRAGDFDGDGRSEILLYANGGVVIWSLENGHIADRHAFAPNMSTEWKIDVADFNGDRVSDALLRHDAGALVLWTMKDHDIARSQTIASDLSAAWQPRPGHFSGDTGADILLQHSGGATVVWEMSEGEILDRLSLSQGQSPAWTIL